MCVCFCDDSFFCKIPSNKSERGGGVEEEEAIIAMALGQSEAIYYLLSKDLRRMNCDFASFSTVF